MQKLIITTRASALALWQAHFVRDEIKKHYPELEIELLEITSKGDKILDKPLALVGGKGHFTKELEDEMLAGNAHLAVHNLKDVPTYIPRGLELVAISKRADQSDVFLSHKYTSLETLPEGAIVGTTSLRRRMQLLRVRPDLKVKDLRGNVNTRLKKLAEGQYDAIILAFIGLHRLDLLKDIPYVQKLPLSMMIPPMGQASLGIEIVSDNAFVREIASKLNDADSYLCTKLERDFISKIEAGCSAPVAVNAVIHGEQITITSMIGFPDGTNIMQESLTASLLDCQNLGTNLAQIMIEKGAMKILDQAQAIAFKEEMPQRL